MRMYGNVAVDDFHEDDQEVVALINPQDDSGVEEDDDEIVNDTADSTTNANAPLQQQQQQQLQVPLQSNHRLRNTKNDNRLRSRSVHSSSRDDVEDAAEYESYVDDDDEVSNSRCAKQHAKNGNNPTTCCCCKATTMNMLASILLWMTVISLAIAVFWYSYELFNHGTDPHLIAWFSAGAFVLLGFPISMYGIIGHLANYNAPNIQVYVVRILWMVPIYSVESWLAMRFHKQAVFIETLRDFYESYVLYSFTQFLIEVLGGEQALILMLKDKSPTRGVHMWGLQWCVKPWLMGQPVRREDEIVLYNNKSPDSAAMLVERVFAAPSNTISTTPTRRRNTRVHWKSPFFVRCKFGVLQYVLIKFLCAVAVLFLEYKGWYKEGSFHWNAGYLYICIVTNVSQCWALYCLIFFYYATKTELSPIRPVGKFLSVKALVFFTWWQSVFISVLYQMDMIPTYKAADERDWSSDAVAKGIQDYLICMEMFIAAVVHTFVFPHSEYSVAAVRARQTAVLQKASHVTKRLGRRKWKDAVGSNHDAMSSKNSLASESCSSALELASLHVEGSQLQYQWEDSTMGGPPPPPPPAAAAAAAAAADQSESSPLVPRSRSSTSDSVLEIPDDRSNNPRPGLFRAFIDTAIPRDLRDNTVNVLKGEYNVEKKTLLHHAATSDQYELFSKRRTTSSKKSIQR